ncbi:putative lipoprotein [Mycobacterium xenopi 4042]|uniref:Putative lipoprotein n=1 Tax=Mycobacterium xenopi 4042 TaxID=1299334 RepID=X8E0F7_MYCXE|nr:putative lipoprotein [Mycobacterium xenopi 4042]
MSSSVSASSTSCSGPSGCPVRMRASMCRLGSINAVDSSRVSATTAFTVRNVVGSAASLLGLNFER